MEQQCKTRSTVEHDATAKLASRENQDSPSGKHGLQLRDRRSRSSNKEPAKEWPITLTSSKQHDKALAWRRLFSQPLACPLSTPGLNLLGLEAQPQQPIQQHVSMVNSSPLRDACHSRQSSCRKCKRYAQPCRHGCQSVSALPRASLPLALFRRSSPCSRRVVMRLQSLFLLKLRHRHVVALHRDFAHKPIALGRQTEYVLSCSAVSLEKTCQCRLASFAIFTIDGDASHHI